MLNLLLLEIEEWLCSIGVCCRGLCLMISCPVLLSAVGRKVCVSPCKQLHLLYWCVGRLVLTNHCNAC